MAVHVAVRCAIHVTVRVAVHVAIEDVAEVSFKSAVCSGRRLLRLPCPTVGSHCCSVVCRLSAAARVS
jgi:hypothetical protein